MVMMPMLLAQSVSTSFFKEENLTQIAAESYYPVTEFFADKISRTPVEINVLTERIRIFLPENEYFEHVVQLVVNPFLQQFDQPTTDRSLKINFGPLRNKIQEIIVPKRVKLLPECGPDEIDTYSFRFCRPRQPARTDEELVAWASSSMEKEIPQSLTIDLSKSANLSFDMIKLIKNDIFALIIIVMAVALGLISLVAHRSLHSVLRWIAGALLSLCAMISLFIVSIIRLPEVAPIFDGFTPSQVSLIKFFVEQPLIHLGRWAFCIGAIGVLLFAAGMIIRRKKRKK